MHDEYDKKFADAMSMLSQKVLVISSMGEAQQCLELFRKINPAMPKWTSPVMDCLHEVITRRTWEILQCTSRENAPGVYVILFADGHIKIGMSKHFNKRLKMLSDQSTCGVESHEFFPCEKAYKVEAAAHRFFDGERVKNEFFKVDFTHACEVVKSLASPTNAIKH